MKNSTSLPSQAEDRSARNAEQYAAHRETILAKARTRREREREEYRAAWLAFNEACPIPDGSNPGIDPNLDAWNAAEARRVAAEEATPAGQAATRSANRAQRYRDAHREELAAKARARRALERAAKQSIAALGVDIFG